jgi:hypothetical protein
LAKIFRRRRNRFGIFPWAANLAKNFAKKNTASSKHLARDRVKKRQGIIPCFFTAQKILRDYLPVRAKE